MVKHKQEDIKKEGITWFAPSLAPKYRYVIELKSNKMSIGIEDCLSKKQWNKGDMEKADYVTPANTIPDAAPVDYVKCFYDALDCNLTDISPVQRTLMRLEGEVMRLELTMNIRFLRSAWVAKYSFDLDPVSLGQIDVLESKVRDQHDELEHLRRELKAVRPTLFVTLEAYQKDGKGRLCWNKVQCDEFVVDSHDGVVKARCEGVYRIGGVINSAPRTYNQTVKLLKNGVSIQCSYCAYVGNNHCVSTPLDCITLLKEGDEISVTTSCDTVTTSHLSIVSVVN
ncbi:hypothetical protein PHYPSEUDO_003671 [Phytophthora pseudosyringae]|uniref:Uncharacterized protein n=1 Tax=Phytophthora pseudosyringae TaxID=221518 RepID=A0A8T1VQN4_9STRA|nr:hypothetical protein PHYPSEUDO_003671 [Phytophthora pseudosyringae]